MTTKPNSVSGQMVQETMPADLLRSALMRCMASLCSGYVPYLRLLILSGDKATPMDISRVDWALKSISEALKDLLQEGGLSLVQTKSLDVSVEQLIMMAMGFGFLRSILTGNPMSERQVAQNVDAAVDHFLRAYGLPIAGSEAC